MPFFNWIFGRCKYVRKKYIIDIPPMEPEKQEKIINILKWVAHELIDKGGDVVKESLVEMAKENMR